MGGFPSLGVLAQQSFSKLECVLILNGLALPRASHSSKITLAGSRRLRSMLLWQRYDSPFRACVGHSSQKSSVSTPSSRHSKLTGNLHLLLWSNKF